MRTLVTGGAGYIGAHIVRLLSARGIETVVVDNLTTGLAERIAGTPLVQMDLTTDGAPAALAKVLQEHRIDTVIHLAARKRVDESVWRPAWYFAQNIGGLATVLQAMERSDTKNLIFSSSAAVYGASEGDAISESAPTLPINPYGETKLIGEWLVRDATRAFDLKAVNLRYFNVAGAGSPELGDRAVLNLVPMAFERIDAKQPPLIFGDDYDTPDGTCIRDFVHVTDLAEAHLVAADFLSTMDQPLATFNVGTGSGASVREVIDTILRITGSTLQAEVQERRAGDPAMVVASPKNLSEATGWRAHLGLDDIVQSAWSAHSLAKAL